MGTASCKIQIGKWYTRKRVLVSYNNVDYCIIGLDVLNKCPSTKSSIYDLTESARIDTSFISNHQCSSVANNDETFNNLSSALEDNNDLFDQSGNSNDTSCFNGFSNDTF